MVLALPLFADHPLASVPCPKKRQQKRIIRAHLLSLPGEREGYGKHNCNLQGVPVATEACRKLLQPEAGHTFFLENWPCVIGPLAMPSCTDSQKGLDSDLSQLTASWQLCWLSWPPLSSGEISASCSPPLALMQALAVAGQVVHHWSCRPQTWPFTPLTLMKLCSASVSAQS